jgi:hypothetical protein
VKGTVSVGAELAVLHRAVQGVADSLDVEKIEPDAEAAKQASAVLNLIASRLRHLRRAIVGAEDPVSLVAPHNVVTDEPLPGDDPDVLLEEGGGARLVGRRRQGTT